MRVKTTIYLEEDTHQWFIRMKAITGLSNKDLLHQAIKLYAAVLNEEKFLSLDVPESEKVKRILIDFARNAEPVCLPQSFE